MEQIIKISEAAAFQIKDMMKEHGSEDVYLRVAVKGGGCTGLSYGMGFEEEKGEKDIEELHHEIRVLIDDESKPILKDVVIDFKQSLMGGGFTIDNPNAIASCGCGSSFRTATNEGTPEDC